VVTGSTPTLTAVSSKDTGRIICLMVWAKSSSQTV
jgi:hypothetical protein